MVEQLGAWTLVRRLGDGSMGIVYEAKNGAGERGALKVLRREHASNPKLADRFRRESHLLQRVQDRNVVRLLEAGEHDGRTFIVLEYVDGPSLESVLEEKGPRRGEDARRLAIDLLRGLHAVHSKNLVHRDVKPGNLMLGQDGAWKLTDFGLARREAAEESIAITREGAVIGTPHYMSPEQCEGAQADARSDLYAAGATLFQAFTGQLLFDKQSFMEVIAAHSKEEPRDLRTMVPELPEDLANLVARLLKKKPDERPASAADALALIGAAVADAPAPPKEEPSRNGPAPKPAWRAPTGSSLSAAERREEARRRTSSRVEIPVVAPLRPPASSRALGAALVPFAAAGGLVVASIALKKVEVLTTRDATLVAWGALACFGFGLARALWVHATESAPAHATLRSPLERLRGRIAYARATDPRVAAELLKALGESRNAGERLLEAGRFAEAGAEFLAASQPRLAAVAFERAGQLERARDAYVAANDREQAARVATDAGQHEDAAELYIALGRTQRAIESFRKAEKPLQVVELLEQAGNFAEAATEVEALLGQPRSGGEKRVLALRGGDLWLRANKPGRAAPLVEQAGERERALELYEQANEPARAGKLALELGQHARAAEHLERAGRFADAGSAYEHAGATADAARCFQVAKEDERSARLWLEAGEPARAAALFERRGLHQEAGEAWKAAGDLVASARMLEKGDDPVRAAQAWLAAGSRAEALRILSAVPRSSPHCREALGVIGDLHAESGRDTEAASAYAQALEGAPLAGAAVRRTITYAEVLGRLGQTDRAKAALEGLRGSSEAPADLEGRIEVVAAGITVAARPTLASIGRRGGRELVGSEIDRYRILGFLGEGATAWIYKAEHAFLGRVAALKLLKAHPDENEQLVSRFIAEGRAVAALRHQNLIEVYDLGQTPEGLLYMALEFVSGGSLRELISRREQLPVAKLARLGADVLAGLTAAHRKGVVHRDLKPENILLDDGGRPKIVDFGIAKILSASDSISTDFVGTPRYTSPEQVLGKPVGPAADQYAFGMIFYEIASLALPFASETTVGWMRAHTEGKPRPLAEAAPHLPPRLAAAIMRCLEKDPAARWEDLEMLQKVFASAAF